MEIVFLGNGGGRIVLDQQILPTAGFRINSKNFKMHVDPGPGALVKSIEHKQTPWELDALFVSHCHIDHCNDANMMIESLNFGNFRGGRGTLIGAESVVNGKGTFEKQLDDYFKNMLKLCKPLSASQTHKFSDSISIKATKTVHEDPSDIGFVLSIEGLKIGYTSDTEYFQGISEEYEGCDFLIFNCLRPDNDHLEFHFSSQDVIKTVNGMKTKPLAIFITHLGMKFLNAGKEAQQKKIEENTGVKTMLASEGLKVDLHELSSKQKKLV